MPLHVRHKAEVRKITKSMSPEMMAYMRLIEERGGLPLREALQKNQQFLRWLLVPPTDLPEYFKDSKGKRRRTPRGRGFLTTQRDRGETFVILTELGLQALQLWDTAGQRLEVKRERSEFSPYLANHYRPFQGTFTGNPHKKKRFDRKANLLTMAKGA